MSGVRFSSSRWVPLGASGECSRRSGISRGGVRFSNTKGPEVKALLQCQ